MTCVRNNTAQLYFILGRADLHWKFCSIPKDGSDIDRFSNRKWVLTMCTIGNLYISVASIRQLETFQCRSALPNIKYNCAVLFLTQVNYLFNYPPKTKNSTEKKNFSLTSMLKLWNVFSDNCLHLEVFFELSAGCIVNNYNKFKNPLLPDDFK